MVIANVAARCGCVGVHIKLGELHHAALVQDPISVVQKVSGHFGPGATQTPRRLPELAIDLDNVIGGDLAWFAYDEAAIEIRMIFGESQRASCFPALPGRVAGKRLVGGIIIAVDEVTNSQGQRVAVRIDLDATVQRPQQLFVYSAVKALYLIVMLLHHDGLR